MAPRNRSEGRDVHIYDAKDPAIVLGGLILTKGVTNANLYLMLEILFVFENNFEVRREGHTNIERNDESLLQPGNYYINAIGISLYNDLVVLG
jgi:hypothetical protein